ncbi:MAG: MATE family efflux transporter [Phycisphaerales bacterium]|nr:MATE family efflux transporter [Phycisphaerales bacterium]
MDASDREPTDDDARRFIDIGISPDDPMQPILTMQEEVAPAIEEGVIRSGRLAGKSMWSAIGILAIPVLLQQTLTAMVGLVDKMLAGSLPESIVVPALDGVGIGSFVGWFVSIALGGLGLGGQALISRAMGSGDGPLAEKALGTTITLGIVWSTLVGVAMWLLVAPLARATDLSPESSRYAIEYVQTMSLGMPFCGVMMVGSMCLFGAGETLKPSLIAAGVNVVNLVASWFLSGVHLRFGETSLPNPSGVDPLEWGVSGIAAGTATSWVIGGLATIWVLSRGVKDLRLHTARMIPEFSIARRVVTVGIPTFFEGIAMWMVNLFVLGFIGQIATRLAREGVADVQEGGLVGAHIITVQWEAFSFLPGFAMGTAAGALAGQYLGAGNPGMARRAMVACTIIGVLIMSAMGVVFMTLGEQLTALISDQPVHLAEAPPLLFICGTAQAFFALSMVLRQGLRGVGDTRWTFLITTCSSYGIRLPACWLLGIYFELGLPGIWMGLMGEIVIRGGFFVARFLHGGWTKIKV